MIKSITDVHVIVLSDERAQDLYSELVDCQPVGSKPTHPRMFELRQVLYKMLYAVQGESDD